MVETFIVNTIKKSKWEIHTKFRTVFTSEYKGKDVGL